MPAILRAAAALAVAAGLLGAPKPAAGEPASPWSESHRSRVRLIAGSGDLAGIEIKLQPGFKTYWRHPGESGLPPTFDWSGSANAAAVEVLWPAPRRFEDPGGVAYGYEGEVILPVRVRRKEAGAPVRLRLKLDYGVCKDICIPAQAELSLALPDVPGPGPNALQAALARVPETRPLGAMGDPAILGLSGRLAEGRLEVAVRSRPGSEPELFVEAPDGWYLAPRGRPRRRAEAPAEAVFEVEVFERPSSPPATVDLRLTLVAGREAVESLAPLDTAGLPRRTPEGAALDSPDKPR